MGPGVDIAEMDRDALETALDEALRQGVSDFVWRIVGEIDRREGREELVI